ncbi:MAG: hypothetical protein QXY52_03320 [Conexivisphaerales archaeon]
MKSLGLKFMMRMPNTVIASGDDHVHHGGTGGVMMSRPYSG